MVKAYPFSPHLFSLIMEILAKAIGVHTHTHTHTHTEKEEVKPFLFLGHTIVYTENNTRNLHQVTRTNQWF